MIGLRGVGGEMMTEASGHGIRAHAGPRIAAYPVDFPEEIRPVKPWIAQFRTPRHFGFRSLSDLNPWPLLRRRRRERWQWMLPLSLLLSVAIPILHLPILFAFLPPLLPAFLAWRARRSPLARSRLYAEQLEQLLACGGQTDELREDCEQTLTLDPDNDAARLILAALLIREEEDRSALLQLAPLRDHRPESGEVVLLAAACYLHLGRPTAALRMLDALELEPNDPAHLAAMRLRRAALLQSGVSRRSELLRPNSPLAEDLFNDELY